MVVKAISSTKFFMVEFMYRNSEKLSCARMNYSAQFPERKILDDSQEEILKGIFEGILRNENSGRFLD
jgi:hypothetical protein